LTYSTRRYGQQKPDDPFIRDHHNYWRNNHDEWNRRFNYYASLHPGQQKPAWLKGGPPPGIKGSGSGERFKQIDTDGNGGVDKAEFQVIADKISAATGQQINVEELTKSYDANGDGLLGETDDEDEDQDSSINTNA